MKILLLSIFTFLIISLPGCDPNNHSASDHPCNFPSALEENSLYTPWSYIIIDKTTLLSIVDTTKTAIIHRDSVLLYDENFTEITSSYEYSEFCPEWIFTNLATHINIPFNDPQALLDLKERTYYLQTSFNDMDTIDIFYSSCLVKSILFNGQNTSQPLNDPNICGASFYFKK